MRDYVAMLKEANRDIAVAEMRLLNTRLNQREGFEASLKPLKVATKAVPAN
ncbi:hypothetical protein PQQ52_06340 [Paraburkholderia sediminicola]|uniref:hypothetical protein n=1 Tax=Paraburkholderia sediminicola TaxID=458836 RepID=UPI0038B8FA2B